MTRGMLIVGAGKLARCIADAAQSADMPVWGFADNAPAPGTAMMDLPVMAEDEILTGSLGVPGGVVVAVGDNWARAKVAARFAAQFGPDCFAAVVHSGAHVAPSASLGAGCVILAGAIVNPGARLGAHVTVWSNAVVEHDCQVADYVTLAPAATVAGCVSIGERSFLGTGASVSHDIVIGADVVVGTGAAVVTDLADAAVYVGCPARRLRGRNPGESYL